MQLMDYDAILQVKVLISYVLCRTIFKMHELGTLVAHACDRLVMSCLVANYVMPSCELYRVVAWAVFVSARLVPILIWTMI